MVGQSSSLWTLPLLPSPRAYWCLWGPCQWTSCRYSCWHQGIQWVSHNRPAISAAAQQDLHKIASKGTMWSSSEWWRTNGAAGTPFRCHAYYFCTGCSWPQCMYKRVITILLPKPVLFFPDWSISSCSTNGLKSIRLVPPCWRWPMFSWTLWAMMDWISASPPRNIWLKPLTFHACRMFSWCLVYAMISTSKSSWISLPAQPSYCWQACC